ncbi:hypothetical protein EMCRGX_G027410 [Ephydatia muelleri]
MLRTAIYAETQAEGESQEGSMEVESSARAKRQWGKQEMEPGECKRGSKNKRMPERICLGKGGLEGVLPPGRNESCRRGGKSPAAGEERVLPPGWKESCRWRGESPAVGEERVLQPGRKESCRWGGKSPAAGEGGKSPAAGVVRVLPSGRKESCRWGGKSPAVGEVRVLPLGRKESGRRGGKSPAAGEERVRPPGGKSLAAGEERFRLPGRKESCLRGGKIPAAGEERVLPPGRERARAALQEGKSEGVCDARRTVCQRVYVQKSRWAKKRQKQESAWREDSGKELIFDLVGRGDVVYCIVTCGARDDNQSRPNNPTTVNSNACGICLFKVWEQDFCTAFMVLAILITVTLNIDIIITDTLIMGFLIMGFLIMIILIMLTHIIIFVIERLKG